MDHGQLGLAAAGHDRHHAVAGLEAGDAGADADHLARQLQARDVLRRAGRRGIAPGQLHHVRAVEPGGLDADEQLAHLGDGIGVLLDDDRAVADGGGAHGCRSLHRAARAAPDARAIGPSHSSADVAGKSLLTRISSDNRGNTASMGALRMPHLPAIPHFPPLWRESRFGLELAELRRSPVFRGHGVPDGDGRAVMLIPGFLAGDGSLATMTHWLRQNGYHTRRAGIRANVGCSEEACARLEARLEGFAEHTGQKVSIVGQSRGGTFARALAVRRPDLVEGIVTLGSPTVSQLRIHPLVLAQVGLVSALGTAPDPRACSG